jgi:hypothetical protein
MKKQFAFILLLITWFFTLAANKAESGMRVPLNLFNIGDSIGEGEAADGVIGLTNLDQVCSGNASAEYGDAREFFRRTFLTGGLSDLLKDSLLRITDKGGSPVVDLQTNFGGGKAHSMLALYHIFSETPVNQLADVEPLLQETGETDLPKGHRASLVGTALNPGQTRKKPDGTKIRTLWGELAWQLGKNEWVAYSRQTYGKIELPGGSLDVNITFAQAITRL